MFEWLLRFYEHDFKATLTELNESQSNSFRLKGNKTYTQIEPN